MNPLPWFTLDAMQAGGLLALSAAFGADGLHRRDRITGWLGLACLLVAARHLTGLLDVAQVIPLTTADRIQSSLASLGFMAMVSALSLVFPSFYPRRMTFWLFLGILPNLVRCVFLPLEGLVARSFHLLAMGTYLAAFGLTMLAMVRAWRSSDVFGHRLLGGLLVTMIPVGVEIYLRVGSGIQLRISGFGVMLMAISLGASWLWVLTHDLHTRLGEVEQEAAGWRSLLPGSTWHTEEESPLMVDLFGAEWASHLDDRMIGSDGFSYQVHRVRNENGTAQGWLEVRRENDPRSFLRGWTVALGADEGADSLRVVGWLEGWGAHVEFWGTVPPREGPFPSVLLWLREPSILAVWRESDLARRRCRWIQVGGPHIEGPHVRLDRPLDEQALRGALQRLVALHR